MTPTFDMAAKIKRLFELAGKNNSEEEANLALQKAQELMAQYNLTSAEVERADTDKPLTEALDIKRVDERPKRGAMYEYQRNLWAVVASVNYVWHWTIPVFKNGRKVSRSHRLVGREANVIAAQLMGDYLEACINRLCPWQGRECLSRSAISWKEGCASRLQTRLREQYWANEAASVKAAAGTTALTLTNVQSAEFDANYAFLYGADAAKKRKERLAEADKRPAEARPAEKAETNAERVKREAKYERHQKAAQRKEDQKWERKDLSAWHAGSTAGKDIGLDGQVSSARGPRQVAGE